MDEEGIGLVARLMFRGGILIRQGRLVGDADLASVEVADGGIEVGLMERGVLVGVYVGEGKFSGSDCLVAAFEEAEANDQAGDGVF